MPDLTVAELRRMAPKFGISGASRMGKAALLEALAKAGASLNAAEKAAAAAPEKPKGKKAPKAAKPEPSAEDAQIPFRPGTTAWLVAKLLLQTISGKKHLTVDSFHAALQTEGLKSGSPHARLAKVTSALKAHHKWNVQRDKETNGYYLA